MKHWSSGPPVVTEGYYRLSPADVEMTSYVLLALLQSNNLSVVPLATPIVRWLSTQRNAYGGFASTQVNLFVFLYWVWALLIFQY